MEIALKVLSNWNKFFSGKIEGNTLTFDNEIGKGTVDFHSHFPSVQVIRMRVNLKNDLEIIGNEFDTDRSYLPIFIGEPFNKKEVGIDSYVEDNITFTSGAAFTTNDENNLFVKISKNRDANLMIIRLKDDYFYQYVNKNEKLKILFPKDKPFYVYEEFSASMSSVYMRFINIDDEYDYIEELVHSIGVHIAALFFSIIAKRQISGEENKYPMHAKPVIKARNILRDNPTSNYSIDDICKEVGMSSSRLRSLFKQIFGVTIHQYILDLKLDVAKQLLLENEKANFMIATELGFSSSSHFTTAFKKKFNSTPKEFKNKYKKK